MIDAEMAVAELEELLEKLGIELRREPLPGPGGLCEVRGKRLLLLSQVLPAAAQVEVIAEALRGLDFSGVYLKPALRELLGADDYVDSAGP